MAQSGSHFYPNTQYQHFQQPSQVPQSFGNSQHYPPHANYTYNASGPSYPQHYQQQQYWQQYPQQFPQQQPNSYAQHNVQQQTQQFQSQPAPQQSHAQNQSHGSVPHYQDTNFQQNRSPLPTNQETCYNCGMPNHFAQNCPEPRRDMPVGQIKRQKRFHGGQMASRQNSSSHTSFQASPGPQQFNYAQQGPTQSHNLFHPNNHQSPRPASSQQWHGQPYQQIATNQNHHPSQQNNFDPHSISHHSPPGSHQGSFYGSPSTPVSRTQYASQTQNQGSPVTSITPQGCPTSASVLTPVTTSRDSTLGKDADWIEPPIKAEQLPQDEEDDQSEEAEDDDLMKLDIPDFAETISAHSEGAIRLVSSALPSNFVVADALYPIAPPAPEDAGRCRSRYFLNVNSESPLEDIRVSPHWRDRLEDPILQEFDDDHRVLSLQSCIIRIKERQVPSIEEMKSQKPRGSSQSLAPRSAQATEMAESLEKVERALADAKAKQAELVANKTKAKSVSIPKPNDKANAEQRLNPQWDLSEQASSEKELSLKTRAPSLRAVSHETTSCPPTDRVVHQSPKDSARNSRPNSGSYEHRTRQAVKGIPTHQSHRRVSYHGQPPPPPPPHQNHTQENRIRERPTNGIDTTTKVAIHGNVLPSPSPNMSPTAHLTGSAQNRKRSYEQQEETSSEDEDDSPKRQQDDVTPRLKRRQPKVAAAYSRRW